MKAIELARSCDPSEFEDRIYKFWMDGNLFAPDMSKEESFVIVIPPPNVTGVLHMGHGLNNVLQDILIRYNRMKGKCTLWVPGTDHAGIATQNVVDKRLRAKGIQKHDLGREKFVEETWKVKKEHHSIIIKQLQRMGASCDWSRERFTLDDGLSKAVKEVFVRLYEKKLVYKGNYLVNWCPSCGTALSDDEVEHEEKSGKMYHYFYPLEDGSQRMEIATTRPETMLGDTAVAVHPEDERYSHLVGKKVRLPLTERLIPVIADPYVDREFGTGAVKITPAHDPNDWDIGNRHNLEKINILTPRGLINDNAPLKYRGLDVSAARKLVVQDLKDAGLYKGSDEHSHQVGHCYRCRTVIEPYLSDQWFVKMKPLAEKAVKAWKDNEVRFYPKRWENTYAHWMKNIRDWCISRQLWWGHRIPVWYCRDCNEMMVLREDPTVCSECGGKNIYQDEDVLDTWFSSWLWPFSTLGWPDKNIDLKKFFPTSALITGYDIIFFWVARMIMASEEFMGTVPFRDIYITPLVRDKTGRKMSKSLGNGIDPLDVIDEYGADALKFTMAFLSAQGQDIPLDKEMFKTGSKFANKIWNASRYILMNLDGRDIAGKEQLVLTDTDKWIYHRLNKTVESVDKAIRAYRFDDMAHSVYEYFWNDFCDWYIEASKLSLYSDDEGEKDRAVSVLAAVLEESLRLLHPFMSFISEEIYSKLPGENGALISAVYPEYSVERSEPGIAEDFASLQELVKTARTIRSEFTIPPEKKIRVCVKTDPGFKSAGFFKENRELAVQLINASELLFSDSAPEGGGSFPAAGNGYELYLFIGELIDIPKEVDKLRKEFDKLAKLILSTGKKLSNEKFLGNAPESVVEKEKGKLEEFTQRNKKIKSYLELLDTDGR